MMPVSILPGQAGTTPSLPSAALNTDVWYTELLQTTSPSLGRTPS